MLVLQNATQPARHKGRIGLAIAGGGPTGGMYELGALRAMEVAIEGLDLNRLDVYVGVSSGAFLAAGLVNRLSTAESTLDDSRSSPLKGSSSSNNDLFALMIPSKASFFRIPVE